METSWTDVVNFLQNYATVLWVVGVTALMVFVVMSKPKPVNGNEDMGWVEFQPRNFRRGLRMIRRNRKDFVFNLLAQDFTDAVENRVYHQEITRVEATEIYRELKQRFPIRALFPAPERLKENIKKRLGKHIEPKFPDAKTKRKMKHLFDIPERVVL